MAVNTDASNRIRDGQPDFQWYKSRVRYRRSLRSAGKGQGLEAPMHPVVSDFSRADSLRVLFVRAPTRLNRVKEYKIA